MLHTMFHGNQSLVPGEQAAGSGGRFMGFIIYAHGGYLGHVN